MSPQERQRLRDLQDRYLALPIVQIAPEGAACFNLPLSPTVGQVRKLLFPAWEEEFKLYIHKYGIKKQ